MSATARIPAARPPARPVVVHRENYICMKADQIIHPGHETPPQRLRRHYYALASLLGMYERMAGYCPAIREGSARMSLVVRECEFTIDHRPVALRILLAAGLGSVYDDWRAEAEAVQEPMHKERDIPRKLGLEDEWRGWRNGTSGYTLISSDIYREHEAIEPSEIMLGWWDAGTGRVVNGAAQLERLEEILPERGYAVRRVTEPERFGGGPCLSAVAVRRMTAGEIRRHKEAARPAG